MRYRVLSWWGKDLYVTHVRDFIGVDEQPMTDLAHFRDDGDGWEEIGSSVTSRLPVQKVCLKHKEAAAVDQGW